MILGLEGVGCKSDRLAHEPLLVSGCSYLLTPGEKRSLELLLHDHNVDYDRVLNLLP